MNICTHYKYTSPLPQKVKNERAETNRISQLM